jgi:tyrosinase
MLMQFEAELQSIKPGITLPYWNWTLDAAAPERSPVWDQSFLGGDGDATDEFRVQDGVFAHKFGNWNVPSYPNEGLPGPGLKRQFGTVIGSLPTEDDLRIAMGEALYDEPNYNSSPFTRGFRNRLEGWIVRRGDPNVVTLGSQLHNRVHLWVGGNMLPMTSPDDPVFFLHHCFVDKIWADWQAQKMLDEPDLAPHYCPMEQGPPGHNYEDVLKPWSRRISEVMDIAKLGYSYAPSRPLTKSPFKSPFME